MQLEDLNDDFDEGSPPKTEHGSILTPAAISVLPTFRVEDCELKGPEPDFGRPLDPVPPPITERTEES
jgi:hypothetical protein